MRQVLCLFSCLLCLPFVGCTGMEGEPEGYFLAVEDRTTRTHFFEGGSASCKINTSFPDGDPLAGKYFVAVSGESDEGATLLMTIHWTELTEAPAPGTYTADQLDFFLQMVPPGEEMDDAMRDFSTASVTVSGEAPAIRVVPDSNWPGVSGHIQCGDDRAR